MQDCDVAIAVADAGAAVVRQYFGTPLQRLDKGAGDFATHADIAAEHAMLAVLRRERPADAMLGEGRGFAGHRARSRDLVTSAGVARVAASPSTRYAPGHEHPRHTEALCSTRMR